MGSVGIATSRLSGSNPAQQPRAALLPRLQSLRKEVAELRETLLQTRHVHGCSTPPSQAGEKCPEPPDTIDWVLGNIESIVADCADHARAVHSFIGN